MTVMTVIPMGPLLWVSYKTAQSLHTLLGGGSKATFDGLRSTIITVVSSPICLRPRLTQVQGIQDGVRRSTSRKNGIQIWHTQKSGIRLGSTPTGRTVKMGDSRLSGGENGMCGMCRTLAIWDSLPHIYLRCAQGVYWDLA